MFLHLGQFKGSLASTDSYIGSVCDSVADPGSGEFLTPGSGIRGSGMNNPDHILESLETVFLWLKYFDADPKSGMEKNRVRDPGWEKIGSGIRDKHPGSATLVCEKDKTYGRYLPTMYKRSYEYNLYFMIQH
jgi:hypothetical protein